MKQIVHPDAEGGKAPVLPSDMERSSPPPLPGSPEAKERSASRAASDTIADDYRVGYGNLCGCLVEVSPRAAKVRDYSMLHPAPDDRHALQRNALATSRHTVHAHGRLKQDWGKTFCFCVMGLAKAIKRHMSRSVRVVYTNHVNGA